MLTVIVQLIHLYNAAVSVLMYQAPGTARPGSRGGAAGGGIGQLLLFSYCNITQLTMLFGKSSVPFIQYFSLDTLLDICFML